MHKSLCLSLLFVSLIAPASADVDASDVDVSSVGLTLLAKPPVLEGFDRSICTANGFQNNLPVGVCLYRKSSPTKLSPIKSVRYSITWNLRGAVFYFTPCQSKCSLHFHTSGETVMINGEKFYYVSSNAYGVQLVTNDDGAWLVP